MNLFMVNYYWLGTDEIKGSLLGWKLLLRLDNLITTDAQGGNREGASTGKGEEDKKHRFLGRLRVISKIVRAYLVSKSENRLISLSRWVFRLRFERFT